MGVNYVWASSGEHKDGVGNFAEQLVSRMATIAGPDSWALEPGMGHWELEYSEDRSVCGYCDQSGRRDGDYSG